MLSSAPLAAPRAQDALWPRTLTRDGASLTVYQPQAIAWPDRKRLTARAAVALTPKGAAQPLLGTIELSLATATDDAGSVILSDPQLISTHFPSLDTARAAQVEARLRAALPSVDLRPVPVASVVASLEQNGPAPAAIRNDPPPIFYADKPASLVVFDGDPVLAPAGKSGISFAVNTNWPVFTYGGTWYLLINDRWFAARAATGPYAPAAPLPPAFAHLPNDPAFADARRNIPARAAPPGAPVPTVFATTEPAEIIVTDGPPALAPVSGTSLERVTNSQATLFFHPGQKQYYVLLSGRWFAAPALTGPWSFATDRLPPDFAALPPNGGADAALLTSVPDTTQSQEAVLKAQIPTTATLKRASAHFAPRYAGPPRFEPIPGTSIQRAVNSASVVLKIGARYYGCENGAWFVAPAPNGPWVLADSLPPAIKTIPPSSPAYPVTYVQVYGATPDAVTFGYTAGYLAGFVSAGVVVYGTGYAYPPYVVPGRIPVFYPYPVTYAGNVWYNSATGAWVRGGTVYGPYATAHGASYYNSATGAWARGGAIYGPYGGAGAFSAYNPSTGSWAHGSASWSGGYGTANASFYNGRTGVSGSTNQNWNPYGRWGSSSFSGPNQTVNTQSRSNANGSAGGFRSSSGAEGAGYHNRVTGNSGGAVKTANGDVYAGRDGNVYRKTDSGWQKYGNGGWNPVNPPSRNNTNGSRNPSASRNNSNLGASNRTLSGRTPSGSNFERGTYQQLQRDWAGRSGGNFGGSFGGSSGGGFQNRGGFRGGGGGGHGRRF